MFGKAIVFITQKNGDSESIVALGHPYSGNQIPKGTIESNENPCDAALREGEEETGLEDLICVNEIKSEEYELDENSMYIETDTYVYARPDETSFNWANLRRGIPVNVREVVEEFAQIEYIEYKGEENDSGVSYQIVGWVPLKNLTRKYSLFYYHLETSCLEESWTNFDDNHEFRLFWLDVEDSHDLVPKHRAWLDEVYKPYMKERLQGRTI